MDLNKKDIDLLEAYWRGTLGEEEAVALKKRLEVEEGFKLAAQDWKAIIEKGFQPNKEELNNRNKLREQLQSIENDLPRVKEDKARLTISWIYGVVAAIVLLLLIWLIFKPFQPKQSLLVATMEIPLRENATLSDDRTLGEIAYDNGAFGEAWQKLANTASADKDTLMLLYAGVAALKAKEAKEAEGFLNTVLASQEWADFHTMTQFYLAIAYAEQGKKEEAIQLLEEIITVDSTYQEKANQAIDIIKDGD